MRRSLPLTCLLILLTAPALAASGAGGAGKSRPSSPPGTIANDAPGESMLIGKHRITLGMPHDEVLKLVGESCRTERREEGKWWITGDTFGGTLYFTGGVLVEAQLDWAPLEPAPGPALVTMKTALAAFYQMVPGDPRRCEVSTVPGGEMVSVVVVCGKMLTQLGISSTPGETDRVWVYQVLGSHVSNQGKPMGDRLKSPSAPSSDGERN